MKRFTVRLKNGFEYEVKARDKRAAISRANNGKGRHVGTYMTTHRKDRAYAQ